MKVIIRFSIDNERNGKLRNKLQRALRKSKFSNKKNTATYTGKGPKSTAKDLSIALSTFWESVWKHPGPGQLDHFWMYVERPRRAPKKAGASNAGVHSAVAGKAKIARVMAKSRARTTRRK